MCGRKDNKHPFFHAPPFVNPGSTTGLNSRPLLPISSHPNDGIEVLTPGHFLVGRPLQALPEANVLDQSPPLLKRWMLCQAITQHGGPDGPQLQRSNKWKTPRRDLQVGDVVLVKEDSLISTHWPLARITATFPGLDGHVRVVTIKTASSSYKRPTTKIVLLLPQDQDGKDSVSFGGRYVGAGAAESRPFTQEEKNNQDPSQERTSH